MNEITISSVDIEVGPVAGSHGDSYFYRIGAYLSKNSYANSQSALHDARRPQRLTSNGRIEPA